MAPSFILFGRQPGALLNAQSLKNIFGFFFILQCLLHMTQKPRQGQVRKTDFPQGNGISTFGSIIWSETYPTWGTLEWMSPNSAWKAPPFSASYQSWVWVVAAPGPDCSRKETCSRTPNFEDCGSIPSGTAYNHKTLGVREGEAVKHGGGGGGSTHWMQKGLECWARTGVLTSWAWQAPPTGGCRARTKVTAGAKLGGGKYSPFQAVETWETVHGL